VPQRMPTPRDTGARLSGGMDGNTKTGETPTMGVRWSVRRRVVAGLATIIVAFAALLGYSLHVYQETVVELRLIHSVYLPLSLGTADIRATQLVFNTLMDRLDSDPSPTVTRGWIDAARRYRPVMMRRLIGIVDSAVADRSLPPQEIEFLTELSRHLPQVAKRYRDNERRFVELYGLMAAGHVEEARFRIEDLKRSERLLDKVLAGIGGEVNRHVAEVAEDAERHGVQATLALALLTLAALLTGAVIVFSTNRLLTPLGTLQLAVSRVAGGDLETRLAVARDDEIGALATAFNRMTDALVDRDLRLLRSERLATTGKMAAQVTHEIRNPLSSLGLNAELLEEELAHLPPAGEARVLLRAIQSEIDRLTGITESYLAFARLPAPRAEFGDLNAAVAAAAEFLRGEFEGHEVSIGLDLDDRVGSVVFDGGQIRQALLNLILNAREAMPGGGAITLSTESRPGSVRLSVADNGPGVPPDIRERIFDAFYTTKRSGTGLGLSLVRQICLAHGGDIEYEDQSGRCGGRFTITLPRDGRRPWQERKGDAEQTQQ
ncbi:MAG TPA: ATP-binding protein, partial [Polyangia bacterium]|nr:ATP-binding protein [Polyangia bacterium]